MSARYYVRAGGQTRGAQDLRELAQLLERAIGADDPIELIYGADGSPLDDEEFRELFLWLPVGASARAQSGPDVRTNGG